MPVLSRMRRSNVSRSTGGAPLLKARNGSDTTSQAAANPRRNKGSAIHSAMAYPDRAAVRPGRSDNRFRTRAIVHAAASTTSNMPIQPSSVNSDWWAWNMYRPVSCSR